MRPFNKKITTLLICLGVLTAWASAPAALAESASHSQIKKNETGLFQDVFDENIYRDLTSYLHLDRLYRLITQKKLRSVNVNLYDEIADSNFFTNRHGKKRMSMDALKKGHYENDGPDTSGKLTIIKGKFEGLHPGFFVKDTQGNKYLLKFDDIDLFELETSAEVIAARFYYAIGYNVPQYTIATIAPEMLVPSPEAKVVDDTGFKKTFTPEKLEEYLLFLPQDADGNYRASASKILEGVNKGHFNFYGRRKHDPDDIYDHEKMREIRALQVFSSWLNNYDVRESNTLDMLVEEDGRMVLKHYLIDFNSALGRGSLFPMFVHEHMLDYGEATKAALGLGFWEKKWQKRWRKAGEEVTHSPAVWDFDNKFFDPGNFKVQLPHYAFKDLTRADAFWAAKIIMKFTDEEIKAIVLEGKLSDAADSDYVSKVLSERRDIIGKYWFDRAAPLDEIDLKGSAVVFKDLGVEHGFYGADATTYHVTVVGKNGSQRKKVAAVDVKDAQIDVSSWMNQFEEVHLWIRVSRAGMKEKSPYVLVKLGAKGILEIIHQD